MGGNSCPIVGDGHRNRPPFRRRSNADQTGPAVRTLRLAFPDGISGIGQDVEEHLLQSVVMGKDRREMFSQFHLKINILEHELLPKNGEHSPNGSIDVKRLPAQGRLPSEGTQIVDDIRGSVHLGTDVVEQFPQLLL